MNESAPAVGRIRAAAGATAMGVLVAISFCHMLNDMMQSLLPALYPMIKSSYRLTFGQIGLLTFTFQFTASLLQPLIGTLADSRSRSSRVTAPAKCSTSWLRTMSARRWSSAL